MRVLVAVVCCVVLHGANAWPWSREAEPVSLVPQGVINAQQHTIAECSGALQAGREGRCLFYQCLEDKFRCSVDGYTVNISQHFCDKIDQAYQLFDADGQIWLNKTSICLMSYMLDIYNSESTTCDTIKTAGIDGILQCNEREVQGTSGPIRFCDFIRTNGYRYSRLMGMVEMRKLRSLNDDRIRDTMISQGIDCGAEMMQDVAQAVFDSVFEVGSSIIERGRSWWNRLTGQSS